MIAYALAPSISLLGRTVLALRLPTALGSAGHCHCRLLVGMVFFGQDERTGHPLARPADRRRGGWAVGRFPRPYHARRASLRATSCHCFYRLCLGLLWWGWRERKWWGVTLAGVCAGLLAYTYIASRFAPFLFLFFGLSFAFPLRSRHQGESAGPTAVGSQFHRRGRAGSCADSRLLRSEPRTLFHSQRSRSGFSVKAWETLWQPF